MKIQYKSLSQNQLTWLFAMVSLLFIVLRFVFETNARVTFDSGRYAEQAFDLPCVNNDIGPLGYPLLIRLFYELGFSWFAAGKIPSLLSYMGIVLFSYKKKFYFTETVLVLSFVTFMSIFSANWSEPIYMLFLYLFLYVLKQFLDQKSTTKEYVIQSVFLLFVLFQIRYIGLFISISAIGIGMLYAVFWRKNSLFSKVKWIAISGSISLFFIMLFQLYIKSIKSKSDVSSNFLIGNPTKITQEMVSFTVMDFNPWFPKVVEVNVFTEMISYGIGLFFLLLLIWFRKKIFQSHYSIIAVLLTFPCILVTYASRYFYSLNPPDYRLLGPYLFVIFLFSVHFFYSKYNRWLFAIPMIGYLFSIAFFMISKEHFSSNYYKINDFARKNASVEMLYVNQHEFEIKDTFQQEVYQIKAHFPRIKEIPNTDSIPENRIITEKTMKELDLDY